MFGSTAKAPQQRVAQVGAAPSLFGHAQAPLIKPAPVAAPAAPTAVPVAAAMPASMAAMGPSAYDLAIAENAATQARYDREGADRAREASAKQVEADRQAANVAQMQGFLQQVTAMPTTSAAPAVPLPGTPSAADLAFARAKDKAGAIGSRAMEAARSAGDGRAIEGVITGTANNLVDVATQQALSESQRAQDVEDRNFTSALTQRQQNLALLPSMMSLLRY